MTLPDSYACRSTLSNSLEKLFASHPSIPYPSHVYIYGNNNTGKSTIVQYVLNKHRHSILWFDCREIYSLTMFYHTFLSSLEVDSIPLMKNFKIRIRQVIYFIYYLN